MLNGYELFMFISNLSFLVPASGFYYISEYLNGTIQLCVAASSMMYHLCLQPTIDSVPSSFESFCPAGIFSLVFLLHIDVLFANIAGISGLVDLLPHRGTFDIKPILITFGAMIVVFVGIASGAYLTDDIRYDASVYMMMAIGLFYIFIYYFNTVVFLKGSKPKFIQLQKYYLKYYESFYLISSLVILTAGLITWSILQRFTNIDYRILHPCWHLIISTSETIFILAKRQNIPIKSKNFMR